MRVTHEGPRLAVVIAARNNAPYLRDAITSALHQTIPCQVVYSDDASTDESPAIATAIQTAHPDRVTIVRSMLHAGVCEARNRGIAATNASHIVHLDGDDILTPTFLADHLAVMSRDSPFAYGPAEGFGEGPRAGVLWEVPRSWEEADIWRGNSCNTSCMYQRWALDGAGGWQDGIGTMWDWDLALRAARFGTPVPSKALLKYRQHATSWSSLLTETSDATRAALQQQVRRFRARISLGSVISGRLPGSFLSRWVEAIYHAVRAADVKPDVSLILSGAASPSSVYRAFRPFEHAFGPIKTVVVPFSQDKSSEPARRLSVATFLADCMNRLRLMMTGDIHWIVEDDILPCRTACDSMLALLCGGGFDPPGAVTGLYRNRHLPDQFVCGFRNAAMDHSHLCFAPTTPGKVDFSGTGCLMLWKDRTPRTWAPTLRGVPAHDWTWSFDLSQMNRNLLVDPQASCGHARTADDILVAG